MSSESDQDQINVDTMQCDMKKIDEHAPYSALPFENSVRQTVNSTPASSSIVSNAIRNSEHYSDFIKLITPRVVFVGHPIRTGHVSKIDDSQSVPRFVSQSLGMRYPSTDEESGLDKFKKYVNLHKPNDHNLTECESRSIVGQEDNSETSQKPIGSLQKGQKKWTSRPPVVGQASSSSNDSGSLVSGSSENDGEDDISQAQNHRQPEEMPGRDTDAEVPYYESADIRTQQSLILSTTREDYISERPPEGSSDQSSLGLQQDLQTDQPRGPSPSSASSVASVSIRPLEWDSGADVGYYQMYLTNNPEIERRLSTIERMALARGSAALLTRSDPEGTTEYGNQPVNTNVPVMSVKPYHKDRLGIPVAESTPFSTTDNKIIIPNRYAVFAATSGSEEDLSPIADPTSRFQLPQQACSGRVIHVVESSLGVGIENEDQLYPPLFPELQNKVVYNESGSVHPLSLDEDIVSKSNQSSPKKSNSTSPQKENSRSTVHVASSYFYESKNINTISKLSDCLTDDQNGDSAGDSSKSKLGKKFNSMEHLNSSKKIRSLINEDQPNTLPRSQSHNSIICEENSETLNTFPKYLLPHGHNPAPTKSASSSSISTVVQKRRDSPKHISKLVQTSVGHQSVGIQASGFDSVHQNSNPKSPSKEEKGSNRNHSSYYRSASSNNSTSASQKFNGFKKSEVSNGHEHNGIACTGAHKKMVEKHVDSNAVSLDNQGVSQEVEKSVLDYSEYVKSEMENQELHRTEEECGTLDSIASSTKTGQNIWIDGRESMGAEDRVNSFEYLPGHVYENVGRQEDVSGGTSSISLNQNPSSQNETTDEAEKLWDTSASSTLLHDIERGVSIMTDFVKNSRVNNTRLKKKLIKKVAEKLIKSDYPEDCLLRKEKETPVSANIPWTPTVPPQKIVEVRNGRETRRSQTKDSPPLETTATRTSSRTSSECFRPRASFMKINKTPTDLTDKCVGTEEQSIASTYEKKRHHSSTESSDMLTHSVCVGSKSKHGAKKANQEESSYEDYKENDKYSRPYRKQRGRMRQPVEQLEESPDVMNTDTHRSSSVDCSGDWRKPASRSEKLFEQKKKIQEDMKKDSKKAEATALLEYLNIERENQLYWIKAEIEHLGNLKRLLEKQEELKKSLNRIRQSKKQRSVLSVVNERNKVNISSKQRANDVKNQPSRLKEGSIATHVDLNEKDINEWDSHHYTSPVEGNTPYSLNKRDENIFKKPLLPTGQKIGLKRVNNVKHREVLNEKGALGNNSSTLSNDDEVVSEDTGEDVSQMRRTIGTETTGNVGVQTSKSVQQLPVIRPDWYKKLKKKEQSDKVKCPCGKKDSCKCMKDCSSSRNDKKSVAYVITFEESPRRNTEVKRPLEEVKISLPERVRVSNSRRISKDYYSSDLDGKQSCSKNVQKEYLIPKQTKTTQSERPTLQDYLLMNRADYVSRAEYRRKCVAELAYLRELRDKSKRHLIAMAPESSDYSQSSTPRNLPPPPLAVKRVFSQRSMRRQTERKYHQLAEVQNRYMDRKRKESYRTNRLMAEVFTKKLQKRALKGEINLSNSVSVISSI